MSARQRMVSLSIWSSRKFAGAIAADDGGPWAGLLWFALNNATDVEGRMEVDADSLFDHLARVARLARPPEDQLVRARDSLANVGLLLRWDAESKELGEIVDFHVHNRVRWDREAPSKLPPPPPPHPPTRHPDHYEPGGVREDSGSTPAEGKGKAGVGAGVTERQGKTGDNGGGPLAGVVTDVVAGRLASDGTTERPEDVARHQAEENLTPLFPGPAAADVLRPLVERVLNLPTEDGRVRAFVEDWSTDRWKANAALKVLRQALDPRTQRKVRNPTAYVATAVRKEAKELPDKVAREIDRLLEEGLRERETAARD